MRIAAQVFSDFVTFGRWMLATRDIDPIYPILKQVIADDGLPRPEAHWLVYLYLCWYNTASAWAAFQQCPAWAGDLTKLARWEAENRASLPCSIERRGLRGGRVLEALGGFQDHVRQGYGADPDTPITWLTDGLGPDRRANYLHLWDRLQEVPHVGRWAAFKWLDLLQHVLDYPLECPDLRMAYCSGPRQGIEALYRIEPPARPNAPEYVARLDALGAELKATCEGAGLSLTYDTLETILCNFNSLRHGRYYILHDWDEHLGHLLALPPLWAALRTPWFRARATVAPSATLLGEATGGWTGVRKDYLMAYRRERVVVHRGLLGLRGLVA